MNTSSNEKLKVYLASGWFTDRTRDILDKLESILDQRSDIDLYSPRRDGIMLPPNQKHDTELRRGIFKENIQNILDADLVIANIDSQDSYNDTGTIYEVGYAMANNIPVVGFATKIDNLHSRFCGTLDGFEHIVLGYSEFEEFLGLLHDGEIPTPPEKKVLFVGTGDKESDHKLVSYIMDSGVNIRWVNEDHQDVYSRIEEIFDNVEYMIAVVDDRKTIVSWMIGQAYARGIPVITYSDHNYGINVMLLASILTHLRGTDELVEFLQFVKRNGLKAVPEFDISTLDSM